MGTSKAGKSKGASKSAAVATAGPGPLAVWRLPLSVGAAAALTGMPLLDAVTTNQHLDLALGRSFGAAFVIWIATGRINHILVDVESRRGNPADADDSAQVVEE